MDIKSDIHVMESNIIEGNGGENAASRRKLKISSPKENYVNLKYTNNSMCHKSNCVILHEL